MGYRLNGDDTRLQALEDELRAAQQEIEDQADQLAAMSGADGAANAGTLQGRRMSSEQPADRAVVAWDVTKKKYRPMLGVLDADLDTVTVTAAAETTIYSHTIPANTLGATGGFECIVAGTFSQPASATATRVIKVKLGATTVFTSTAFDPADSTTWKWRLVITCKNSAAGAQKWAAHWVAVTAAENLGIRGGNEGSPAGVAHLSGSGYAASAEDTTADLLLDITVTLSNTTNSPTFVKEIAILGHVGGGVGGGTHVRYADAEAIAAVEGEPTLDLLNVTIDSTLDINHTAAESDDHAVEVDVDAAGFGDVKAFEVFYVTGGINLGDDEGVILINIDQLAANGGEVFGYEILATEGSATIFGLKTGVGVGPVHQDVGDFADPTTGTDNTPAVDVAAMIDNNVATTTAIFEADTEYIIIGAAAAFQELEIVLTQGASGAGIKPKFEYSIAGTHQFTEFTPVDGTNAFKNTGIIAWDASDLTDHVADDVTGTFDIKITRQRTSLSTTPILGYARSASTTEYVWDKDGNIDVKDLALAGQSIKTPKRTLVLTAQGGKGTTTNGCDGPTQAETGATAKNYFYLSFAANEKAFWQLVMPDNWDGDVTAMTAKFHWLGASGHSSSDTVIWGIKAVDIGNDEVMTGVFGTQRTVTDTVITAGRLHISGATASSFFPASPDEGELVIIEVERTGGTMTEEALLLAVHITYTTNAYSDS